MPHMRWPTGRDRFRAKNDFCHRRFLVFRDAASSSITHSLFYQSNQIRTWTKKGKSKKKKCKGNEMWGGIPGWLIISMKKWKTVKMQWSTRSTCAKAIEFQFDLYLASASVISYSEDVTCSDGQVFFLIESVSQIRWCIMILQRSRGVTKWQSGSQV